MRLLVQLLRLQRLLLRLQLDLLQILVLVHREARGSHRRLEYLLTDQGQDEHIGDAYGRVQARPRSYRPLLRGREHVAQRGERQEATVGFDPVEHPAVDQSGRERPDWSTAGCSTGSK